MPLLCSIRIVGDLPQEMQDKLLSAFESAGFIGKIMGNSQLTEQDKGYGNVYTICVDRASENTFTQTGAYSYHYRYIWVEQSSVGECVESFQQFINISSGKKCDQVNQDAEASVQETVGKVQGRLVSTRGRSNNVTFMTAVLEGIAKDRGLYIPTHFLTIPPSQIAYFCQARELCYNEAAQIILEKLVDESMSPWLLRRLIKQAYDPARWSGKQDICPVVAFLSDTAVSTTSWYQDISIMELYHGPTAAFKDFGLQLFGLFFNMATQDEPEHSSQPPDGKLLEKQKSPVLQKERNRYMILTATSGDTGAATISGFTNAAGKVKVMVLYPIDGVSPVQKLHMLSCDDGVHVRVVGMDTNFDFCQKATKDIFTDPAVVEKLATLHPPLKLSSANSINWGRLIPQVVYYCWAYRQYAQRSKELVTSGRVWNYGDPIDVVVPCGNFGNILAGFIAKLIGFPIRKLIAASNTNDVLYDFIRTGCYDIRTRRLKPTASPSIDILKASNVERLLYILSDGDTSFVNSAMAQLDTEKYFQIPEDMRKRMSESFEAGRCNEEECAEIIKEVFMISGGRQLIDPHTAVAMQVAKLYRQRQLQDPEAKGQESIPPLVVLSTAHWSKFPEPVLHAIKGEGTQLTPSTCSPNKSLQIMQNFYTEIQEICRGRFSQDKINYTTKIHPALVKVLRIGEAQFREPRAVREDIEAVKAELIEFATV